MSNLNHENLNIVYWQDVREQVSAINPELADIIDQMSPDRNYPLIQASYNFGDLIIKEGETFLPSKTDLISLNDPSLPKKFSNILAYSSIPLFLTLENANEVFIHSGERAIPLNTLQAGSLLGLFETIDFMCGRTSSSRWCVSAGSRNLFMLPKLNDISGFKKLKIEFDLDSSLQPRQLTDHWRLFKDIAQHPNFKSPWKNTVLFFTRSWFEHTKKDPAWFAFERYVFRQAWTQMQFAIAKLGLNLSWQSFGEAIADRNLKPAPYLIDQIKHLLLISMGRMPGFKNTDFSDRLGPLDELQKIIMEVYELKKYFPTIFYSCHCEQNIQSPLYYSLSYPALIEGLPTNNTHSTIMLDLREIKFLMDTIHSASNKIETKEFNNKKFTYFHVEVDKYHEIQQSTQLTELDASLLNFQKKFPHRQFCETSQFWRGCFMIQEK